MNHKQALQVQELVVFWIGSNNNISVANKKRTGESGQPCLTPEVTHKLDSGHGCHLSQCEFLESRARMARIIRSGMPDSRRTDHKNAWSSDGKAASTSKRRAAPRLRPACRLVHGGVNLSNNKICSGRI